MNICYDSAGRFTDHKDSFQGSLTICLPTLQRIKQRSQSSSIVPYLTRPQLVKYAENLVRDAQFSVVGNKLVVRYGIPSIT